MVDPLAPLAQLEQTELQDLPDFKGRLDLKVQLANKDQKAFKGLRVLRVNLVLLGRMGQVDLRDRKELPEVWVYRV
jgi:hypothetical protein